MEAVPCKKIKLENENSNKEENGFSCDSSKMFTKENTEEMKVPSIDILDDDCMEIIFSYLSMTDLIRIERVSKRWRQLSLKSWKNFKKINIREYFGSSFDMAHLNDVLRRCGDYLTHLDIRDYGGETKIPLVINEYCKNLEHLGIQIYEDIENFINDWKRLDDSIIRNLKSFHIDGSSSFSGSISIDDSIDFDDYADFRCKFISHFLKSAGNLEKLHVECFQFMTGLEDCCLLHLNDKCTTLSVKDCCFSSYSNNFKEMLKKLSRLENLNIGKTELPPEVLEPISEQLKSIQLEEMWLSDFFSRSQFQCLNFPNLWELDLTCNYEGINDENLGILISKCLLLETLYVAGCRRVTDEGFLQLGKLENLTFLDVSLTNISDSAVKNFGRTNNKLKQFSCYGCPNVTSAALAFLVSTCCDLNYLYFEVQTGEKINHLFFEDVLNHVKHEPNRVLLEIRISLPPDQLRKKNFESIVKGQAKRWNLTKESQGLEYNVCTIKFQYPDTGDQEMRSKRGRWYIRRLC